jgi:hypothetical protein
VTLARVRSLIVIGVLAVIAIATVIWAIATDAQTSRTGNGCGAAVAQTAIPPAKSVKLRVLNATDQEGLATRIGQELKKAGFAVIKTGNSQDTVESSAQVRYGPKGLGAASLVRAYVKSSETVQDDKRKDAVVDLILGDEFASSGVTPADQVKDELAKLGPLQLETDQVC